MNLLNYEICETKVKSLMNGCKSMKPKMLEATFSAICSSLHEVDVEPTLENIQAELIARIVTCDSEFEAKEIFAHYYKMVRMNKPYICHRRYR